MKSVPEIGSATCSQLVLKPIPNWLLSAALIRVIYDTTPGFKIIFLLVNVPEFLPNLSESSLIFSLNWSFDELLAIVKKALTPIVAGVTFISLFSMPFEGSKVCS